VGSPNVLNTLATTIKLHHSGYLYIWVSNETQNWMVFFDNLRIEHFTGPMIEVGVDALSGVSIGKLVSCDHGPMSLQIRYKMLQISHL